MDNDLKGLIIAVKWEDATVYPAWRSDDPSEWTPELCFSVGIIIDGDEEKLTIAQTVNEDNVSTVLVIPQGCILEFEVLHEQPIRFGLRQDDTETAEDYPPVGSAQSRTDESGSECDCP